MADFIGHKRDGTLEDVSLDKRLVNGILQGQHVSALGIVHDNTGVLALVQPAELPNELVIDLVQPLTELGLLLTRLRLGIVEFLVGIAYLVIQLHALLIGSEFLWFLLWLLRLTGLLHGFHGIPHGEEIQLDGLALLRLTYLGFCLNLYFMYWFRGIGLAFSETKLHLGRVQDNLTLLSVCIGLVVIHKILIKVSLEIIREQLGNTLHTTVMGAYQGRLAVGVGAFLHLRGHDSLRVRSHHRLPPMAVHRDIRPVLTAHGLEALVYIAEGLRIRVE